MAKIVLGIGTSHGPTIRTVAEDWPALGAKDQDDGRFDYAELLRRVKPDIESELTPERMHERFDACQRGIDQLADVFRQASADVMVVVSNPHTVPPDDYQPVFGVYRGETLPVIDRSAQRFGAYRPHGSGGPRRPQNASWYPGQPELANHMIESLVDDGFDVALADQYHAESVAEEAWGTIYDLFVPGGTIPMVPFILSRYLPNQATPARCFAVGQAIRQAIESWDAEKRVVLVASCGLSHQVIDEELDRMVIDALVEHDVDRMRSIPRQRMNFAPGTPEILNWVTVAGALDPSPMTLIDYIPCYRSVAGTGQGVTFGYWEP